jgi:hypothetical protein
MKAHRDVSSLSRFLQSADGYTLPRQGELTRLLVPKAPPHHPTLVLRSEAARASTVGDLIVDVDREARRTAAFLEKFASHVDREDTPTSYVEIAQGGRAAARPRAIEVPHPVRTDRGSLVLRTAKPGSSELVLWMVGTIADVLLSDPVQCALALHWFLERIPRRWSARRHKEVPEPPAVIMKRVMDSADLAIRAGSEVRLTVEFSVSGDFRVQFRSVPKRRK